MKWRNKARKPILTKEIRKMDTKEQDLWDWVNIKNE